MNVFELGQRIHFCKFCKNPLVLVKMAVLCQIKARGGGAFASYAQSLIYFRVCQLLGKGHTETMSIQLFFHLAIEY